MPTKNVEHVLSECSYEFDDEPIIDVNQHSPSGDTPLHVMCLRGDLEGAKILFKAGAAIQSVGDFDRTPIYSAIMAENINLINFLIEHGASLHYKDDGGKTPLDFARSLARGNALGDPEIISVLERATASTCRATDRS